MTLESLAEETLKCCHVVGFTDQASSGRSDVRGQWMAALSDENNKRLAMGALIIQKAREAIKSKAGFTCSAGIAHNKVHAGGYFCLEYLRKISQATKTPFTQ